MKTNKEKQIGIIMTVLSSVFFGCMPLFVQQIKASGSNSISITFFRFLLSIPVLYLYLKWKKIPLGISKKEWMKITLISIAGYGATPLLLFTSYNYIPSGAATNIHFAYPALTLLGGILFLKRRPDKKKLLSVILCVAGIILFYNGGIEENGVIGMALAFASGVTYSFYVIYLEESGLQEMPSFKLILYMQLIACIMLMGLALVTNNVAFPGTVKAWGIMFVLSIALCFVGVFGFQIGVKYLGGVTTTILSTLEPITSLVLGILLLNETIYPKNMIGCILILMATYVVAKEG